MLLAAVGSIGLFSSSAPALDIALNFNSGASAAPSYDSNRSGLISLFNFAESYYQDKIVTAHTLTINFWYENLSGSQIGLHTLLTQSGGRETSCNIRIDPNVTWFIDPTPSTNVEFNMQQTLWRDLTVAQRDDFYNYGANIPQTFEVGFRGAATAAGGAQGATDMLSVVLHEVGHALGLSAANDTTVSQTADGDYDFTPSQVFGRTLAVETANNSGDDGLNIGHLESNWALMNPSIAGSTRIMPSHTDLLAMSSGGLFGAMDIPRREYYGGGNWNNAANWTGNRLPEADDDAFVRSADGSADLGVGLAANAVCNNLNVSEGANVITNGFLLDASNIITISDSGTRLDVSPGGSVDANQITVQATAVINMLGGGITSSTISIAAGSKLSSVLGSNSVVVSSSLNNNGTIDAFLNSTLTLNSAAASPWNLDGGGNGVVHASSGNILVATGAIAGQFTGTMRVDSSRFIQINQPWTLGSTGLIDLNGGADFATRARMIGGTITLLGTSQIQVSGLADIDAPVVINGGTVSVFSNSEHNFNGVTTVNGGTYNVNTGGELDFNAATTLSGGTFSTPAPTVGGVILFDGPTTYAGNTITLSGVAQQRGNATVSADTVVTGGGYLDMDGSAGTTVWTLNKYLTLSGMSGIENTASSNTFNGTLNINNTGSIFVGANGGRLTVGLGGSITWAIGGTANLDGSVSGALVTIPTLIAGSDLTISGTLNMQDRGRIAAKLNLTGTANILDAASELHLDGGTQLDPNTMTGTIAGPGTLRMSAGHELHGRGTIAARIDFDDSASLRADNGTLTINGAILDVGTIGTADADGILNIPAAWNSNVANQIELKGGSIIGGAITNGTVSLPGLITGNGTVATSQVHNDGKISARGVLTINTVMRPDLDGFNGNGIIEAITGNLIVVQNPLDTFDGTTTVGALRTMTFQGGWSVGSAGVVNLNGANVSTDSARIAGTSQTIAGTVNVDLISSFQLQTTLTSTARVNVNDFGDILRLEGPTTVAAGATFTGAGKLTNLSTLTISNNAVIGVRLDNNGTIEIGASPGAASVQSLTNISGTIHFEIGGATPGSLYDTLSIVGALQLVSAGTLDVDLINGFVPAYLTYFNLITAGSVSGTFGTLDGRQITPQKFFVPVYTPTQLRLAVAKPGDANIDGAVNFDDLLVLAQHYNTGSGKIWQTGDFSGNGIVDFDDLLALAQNYGLPLSVDQIGALDSSTFAADFALARGMVPEPASLAGLLGLACIGRRRR